MKNIRDQYQIKRCGASGCNVLHTLPGEADVRLIPSIEPASPRRDIDREDRCSWIFAHDPLRHRALAAAYFKDSFRAGDPEMDKIGKIIEVDKYAAVDLGDLMFVWAEELPYERARIQDDLAVPGLRLQDCGRWPFAGRGINSV